ncbi:mechanosensitive ion channel [Clostridium sediminicola]|uniref:mechanosensitive ion channel family protein n=1 Tax=Clostridium sediminicola TaxID=3114879 RepID=UPI0031F1FC9E
MKGFLTNYLLLISNSTLFTRFIITLSIIFLGNIIIKISNTYFDKSKMKPSKIMKIKRRYSLFIRIIVAIFLAPVWLYNSKELLTFLGLFSAGMAFAFRDIVANFLGWSIINSHKIYQVGDRIKIGNNIGDVLKIDWFHTTIVEVKKENGYYGQSTGRYILIPNIKILTEEVVNENNSFPYTWNEITFKIPLDSNWKKEKNVILQAADITLGDYTSKIKSALEHASKEYPIYYKNIGHTIYTSFEEDKIILKLRFMCKSKNFRNIEHSIVEYYLENKTNL